ncbi:MAG: porin family protein [Firmicutes bacterium]|nr:porin family protein [Bacillota bacterium]MCM1400987.1 porin family protein [Bacteroides sp.]MCM1476512.1 porin family protein [Bacteroides sp.]
MKRIILCAVMAMIGAAALQARETEVSVSYGGLPAMSHISAYHNNWHGMGDCWGTVNATIDHKFGPRVWCGLSYTYSTADSYHAWDGRYGKVTWHGLMANVRYEWLERGSWRLYSHAGLGALVEYYSPSWEDSFNHTHMAFQVSPIGIEADLGRYVGVFAEVGYGIQGIGKVGLRIGF